MTTTTPQRRAAGDTLLAMRDELRKYSAFPIARMGLMVEGQRIFLDVSDEWGYNIGEADAATLDDAFIALAHQLAGTEEAPF